jgi:hypothetical protein
MSLSPFALFDFAFALFLARNDWKNVEIFYRQLTPYTLGSSFSISHPFADSCIQNTELFATLFASQGATTVFGNPSLLGLAEYNEKRSFPDGDT